MGRCEERSIEDVDRGCLNVDVRREGEREIEKIDRREEGVLGGDELGNDQRDRTKRSIEDVS